MRSLGSWMVAFSAALVLLAGESPGVPWDRNYSIQMPGATIVFETTAPPGTAPDCAVSP